MTTVTALVTLLNCFNRPKAQLLTSPEDVSFILKTRQISKFWTKVDTAYESVLGRIGFKGGFDMVHLG